MRVLVVNDPELAEAIGRLRGEWAERSGGLLSADSKSLNDLAAQQLDADVVVFPARYLGEFGVRNWLRPVRPNVLESRDADMADVFPLVRRGLINWGGQTMALPLGIDLMPFSESIGPKSAVAFLAAAAPSAVSEERLGLLFDPQTMKPRVADPQFVDALLRLAHTHADNGDNDSAQPADDHRVPVLGFGDRVAAVTTSSRNAASAFQLLAWLAGQDASTQLARAGDGTLPVRRSLASSPAWYDAELTSSQRADIAKALQSTLSQNACLLVPRIPAVDQYMAALDEAVQVALSQQIEPEAALRKAAEEWEKITDAHGRGAQRIAHLKHLGVTDP